MDWKERSTLSSFAEDKLKNIENSVDSTKKKIVQLMNDDSKDTGIKTNMQKTIAVLSASKTGN